jgi:hypothetical protein|nr:MAG TPA: hypothetical protein [Caudoviricetes sp.]
MKSLGRCSYEFLETFRIGDIENGKLKYSQRAIDLMSSSGIDDRNVTHYAKVRVTSGPPCHAMLTLTLLPYGEPLYVDTICLESSSWLGLVPVILSYISGSLGETVGDRVLHRHAGRLAEWLESVKAISETSN